MSGIRAVCSNILLMLAVFVIDKRTRPGWLLRHLTNNYFEWLIRQQKAQINEKARSTRRRSAH